MLSKVTFKGSPLTLVGRSLKENTPAPDFVVVSQDLKEKRLADFSGKIKVITFFPSLDTPVCDLQVKEFNKKTSAISPEVAVIGISKDLLFAQGQGHHPHIGLGYAKLKITLTTHAAGGLTDNDFILAGMIDQLNN
ncbi:MAG: 4a-hydroxytetrahydrobiopterin dehydratase [Candidatus Omnitrophota bacterium]